MLRARVTEKFLVVVFHDPQGRREKRVVSLFLLTV